MKLIILYMCRKRLNINVLYVISMFCADSSDVRVVVLYPENGISPTQRAQMVSAEGHNVHVVGKYIFQVMCTSLYMC